MKQEGVENEQERHGKDISDDLPQQAEQGAGAPRCACRAWGKLAVVLILVVVVAAVLIGKSRGTPAPPPDTGTTQQEQLPRLVDLGAGKCIPCKMMAPILEELKTEYAGKLEIEFIDVWKDPAAGDAYGIRVIPTQIFYNAGGKELFRHEGFYSKEDILKKWQELGVNLDKERKQ